MSLELIAGATRGLNRRSSGEAIGSEQFRDAEGWIASVLQVSSKTVNAEKALSPEAVRAFPAVFIPTLPQPSRCVGTRLGPALVENSQGYLVLCWT